VPNLHRESFRSAVLVCLFTACLLIVGVGARHEPDRVQGVSHFVEHMLFKGTTSRPTPKDVSVSIEELGGILNAETGKEVTVYWDKVSQRHWSTAVELLADVLRNSLFLAEEIEKRTGYETRSVNLGHTQRGGTPTAYDRMLATRYGIAAIDLVHAGRFGRLVVLKGTEITDIPLEQAIAKTRTVGEDLFEVIRGLQPKA